MPIRVHKLAKDLGLSSKELMEKLLAMKVKVAGHMSSIDDDVALKVKTSLSEKVSKPKRSAVKKPKKKTAKKETVKARLKKTEPKNEKIPAKPEPAVKPDIAAKPEPVKKAEPERAKEPVKTETATAPPAKQAKLLEVEFPVTIKQLSVKIGVKPSEIIAKLLKKNVLVTINQSLPEEISREIALDYGFDIKEAKTLEEELIHEGDDTHIKAKSILRTPVVTFMGHVDHGKTSLLDYIRNTKVVDREKGGITQHIGAYMVKAGKGSVTFLDTPGHEAFTAMRARGANATDIVVLVVAADDGVMPQTEEAIDHASAAGVPIVVAINKCDLPDIKLDRIKQQLNQHGLMPEDWGGKTIMVPVSAKTGQGVNNLLEMLLLEAELLELKAKPSIRARGVVVEAKLCQGKGITATLLVKNGTLRVGDTILSGLYYGKIKAMINDRGARIKEALPSSPVEVLGLQGVPEAGEEFFVVKDEKKARTLSMLKQDEKRQKELSKLQRASLETLYEHIQQGMEKELKIILKTDVQGSAEALQKSLEMLSTDDVRVKIMHVGVGNINESDVMLAVVSNAVIIGFHVKIDPKADEVSKKENVDIKKYDVIYEAINDVRAAMEGLLEPIIKENIEGRAKVQQPFKVSKIGTVAGSIVIKGTIARSHTVRLIREGKEIYKGKIRSLKRVKDDVRDVREGIECGIALENQNDIKKGDIIEAFTLEKVARRLEKRK